MKLPFSKVLPFSLTTEMLWVPQYLEVLLGQLPYNEIREEQVRTAGFIPAINNTNLVEPIGKGAVYIRYKHTEKALPKAYINKKVQEQIDRIKEEEERDVRRPERQEIVDKVILELIPHAIPKDTIIGALLTRTHIFIDTSSAARAEDLLSSLRAVMGSLPVQVMTTTLDPKVVMTDLMLERMEDDRFKLGERFKAKAKSGKSAVSGTHLDLDNTSLQALIDDGREVVELELTYERPASAFHSSVWFVLGKDLNLKGIVWPPELSDLVAGEVGDDKEVETYMRASLLILQAELENLVGDLGELLGGETFLSKEGRKPAEHTLAAALGNLAETLGDSPAGRALQAAESFESAYAKLQEDFHGMSTLNRKSALGEGVAMILGGARWVMKMKPEDQEELEERVAEIAASRAGAKAEQTNDDVVEDAYDVDDLI